MKFNLTDKIIDILGLKRKAAIGTLPADRLVFKSLREIMNTQGNVVSLPYKQSLWVYSAITAISNNVSRVPFVIKKEIGAGLSKKIESGPIYELFMNPNPLMSQRQLIEATMIFLGIYGEAFWILEGRTNVTELPKEIWTFSPSYFTPVVKNGNLVGWLYNSSGDPNNAIPFAPWEIIQFKYYNPYDNIRGMSPLDAAKEPMNQDYYATRFNSAFFKNGAKVGGFITVDGELTEEQFNRILKQFEDRHGGYDKAHKIALIEGGGKYTEASISQKDMDYIEGKKLTRQEILAAFHVNEVVLGMYGDIKSYSGLKAADKQFWEECLLPKTHYIEDHLWSKFFMNIGQRRGKGKIWGEFDLATVGSLQSNYEEKVVTAAKMAAMGFPINDINRRLDLGMQDVSWGDQWWVPGGYLPVGMILDGTVVPGNANPGNPKPAKMFLKQSLGELECCDDDNNNNIISANEADFRSKIKKFVFDVRKKTLGSLFDEEFVHPDIKREFAKLSSDLQQAYFHVISNSFTKDCESVDSKQKINNTNIAVVSYISERIELITEKFADLLESLFMTLEELELNKDEGAEKVRVVFNLLTQKSMEIAKYEVNQGQAFGHRLFLQRSFGSALEYVKSKDN